MDVTNTPITHEDLHRQALDRMQNALEEFRKVVRIDFCAVIILTSPSGPCISATNLHEEQTIEACENMIATQRKYIAARKGASDDVHHH